jgi:uncharacterized protein
VRFLGVARVACALVQLCHRWPRAVTAAAVIAILAGIAVGARLGFETNVLNLMPRHDPAVTEFKRVLDEFGTVDTLVIVVRIEDEARLETGLVLVDALEAELRGSPHLARIEAHLEDPVHLAETMLRHAVLFLDEKGLAALQERLTREGLRARAADIRAALESPQGLIAKEFLLRDPLGFLPLLLARLNRAPAVLKVDFSSGYYLSADHTLALLLIKPVRPAQDIRFDRVLMPDLERRIATARARVAVERDLDESEVPRVQIGGGYRIALDDGNLITRDVITNALTSLAGVLLLFFLAYRRFATARYAFLPLAVGLALTFTFAGLALGQLNSATAGVAALLVGLGIDFTIVLYARYLEGRCRGLSLADALAEMAATAGPAVALGALTTFGTFYAFLGTRFIGLREFGLLTGTGILFMAVVAFLLLPALVTLFDRERELQPPSRWFDVGPLLAFSIRRRRLVFAATAVVTVLALLALPRIRFDDDMRNLRSSSNQGVAIQDQIGKAFGLSFNAMMVRIEAPDVPSALARVQSVVVGLDGLVKEGVVSSYESLANLVPPEQAQERALAWLAAHRDLAEPGRVQANLLASLKEEGLVAEAFAPGLATLAEALNPTHRVSIDVWQGTPVQQVVERSLRVRPGAVTTVINVFSPTGMWRREAPPQLVELVSRVPGAHLTGVNMVAQALRRIVWQDSAIAGAVGLVAVLIILWLDFRSLRSCLLCLAPPAFGIVWTLGVMAAFGLALNLLNVFVITMVIGVGSDYGIYVLQRLQENGTTAEVAQTGRAVLLAALCTLVGFGSLVTTHYPGLRSMGWMAALGVSFSYFVAIFLVPLFARRKGTSPGLSRAGTEATSDGRGGGG